MTRPQPATYFLSHALLHDGWARDVLLRCGPDGRIASLVADSICPHGAQRLPGVALPGLVNLHSHAHQRAIAGLGETGGPAGDSFWGWREAMYRAVARLDPDLFEAVAAQLYVEMLKSGFTAVAEFHYLHHQPDGLPYADPAEMSLRVLAAAGTAGIGLSLLPVLYQTAGFDGAPAQPAQRRFVHSTDAFLGLIQRLSRLAAGGGFSLGVAPHSLRAVPPAALAALLAATPSGPVHIHVAEQQREVADCLAHTGQRPVQWLLDHANPDRRWCLVHATHITAPEIAALAASGATVGLCPTTEANLGDGIFPAAAYLAVGGRFGIGSDSHVSVSPVEELRWLEYAQRLSTGRRAVLAPPGEPQPHSLGRHLFETALAGGAAASGLGAPGLAIGARADIVALDAAHPLLVARSGDAWLDGWIFAGNAPLVRDVVSAGRHVVADFRHAAEPAIARRFAKAMARLAA